MASRGNDSDGGGSMTPSEQSDGEERSEHDSDYETDEGKEEEDNSSDKCLNIIWTGYGKRIPVIMFNVGSILDKEANFKMVGERYHMAFKFYGAECKIIRNILQGHGFREVHPNCPDFNVIWTGCHLKPFTLRNLTEFQKVNHFPRSSELTRKDRLFKNVQRMQQIKGVKHFDFLPQTFVMPGEYQEFCSQFLKDRGPWIVKPVASSRGRGVFLVNHPEQVPFDENVIVSHYVHNPLVVDGFKFDLRLYVAVTSYDPLVIYLYEEGLTRFATVKYEKSSKHLRNQCMHLTNYSVNKKSNDYVKNDNPDVEDYGNKWSMGALLRYLRSIGKDTAVLMMRIEDVVIKTLLSVELSIATACKMFMPFRGNCFELYGFDILVDDTLKPWVLEVNLSPSLACDSPLDLKIKGNMLCDLFSLTGIVCHDPMVRSLQQQSRRNQDLIKMTGRAKTACTKSTLTRAKPRPLSAAGPNKTASVTQGGKTIMTGLNSEEIKIVRRVKEEEQRKGGWIRIFPGPDTWDVHGPFLQFNTSHNMMLHQRLYPERHKYVGLKSFGNGASSMSAATRSKNGYLQVMGTGQRMESDKSIESYTLAMVRASQYERKLGSRTKRRRKDSRQKDVRGQLVQGMADDMEDGEQQSEEEYEQIDGRGRHCEEEDKKPSKTESIRLVPFESGQAPLRHSKALIENRTQEVKVEVSHPLPASLTQSSPSTTPSLTRPQKWDIIELVTKGGKLSKVQARSAFAMYLRRVKERLMSDTGPLAPEDEDTLNEQMDLVLRFLKRAAVNLQQTFRVVIPSHKLTMGDRRHILAKQLADFVHIYNRETDQLKNQLKASEKTGSRSLTSQRSDSESSLDDAQFYHFIAGASESELEHMLTTYTKLNKSSSIFLGSSITSSTSPSKPPHIPLPPPQVQRFDLMQRRREGGEGDPQGFTGASSPLREYSTSCVDSHGTGSAGSLSRPSSAASTAAANSASVICKKLGRPHSASNYKPPDLQTHVAWTEGNSGMEAYEIYPLSLKLTSRPSSAKPSPFSTSEPVVDTYNEEAIREALQRLTVKQQTRQYAAGNKSVNLAHSPSRLAAKEDRHQRGSLSPLDEQTDHPTIHPGTLQRSSSRPGSGVSRTCQEGQGESTPSSVSRQQSDFSLSSRADNMDYGFFTISKPESLQETLHISSLGKQTDQKSLAETMPTHSVVSVSSSRSNSQTSEGEQPSQSEHMAVQPGSVKPPYPQIVPDSVGHSDQACEGQKGAVRKEKQLHGKKPPLSVKEGPGSKQVPSTNACSATGGGEKVTQGHMYAVGEPTTCVGLSKQAPLSLSGTQLSSHLLPSRGYANQGGDCHFQSTQKTQSLKWSSDLKSRMAMEASKAKHHAMVAQAHAAQRVSSTSRLLRDASKPPHTMDLEGSIARGAPTFSPRPPAQPASSSRSQPSVPSRTTRLSAVENLSHNLGYHNGLKHDIHTLLHRKAQTNAGH